MLLLLFFFSCSPRRSEACIKEILTKMPYSLLFCELRRNPILGTQTFLLFLGPQIRIKGCIKQILTQMPYSSLSCKLRRNPILGTQTFLFFVPEKDLRAV